MKILQELNRLAMNRGTVTRLSHTWLMTLLLIAQPALAPLGQTPALRSAEKVVRPETRKIIGAKKAINPVPVVVVPAASFELLPVAPDSIASAFGTSLANQTLPAPGLPLPTSLGNTVVVIRDSKGIERIAPEFFVSPGQINFLVPAETASGTATISVVSGDGTNSEGTVEISTVIPAVFTASQDGSGVLAANALRVKSSGAQIYEPVSIFDEVRKRHLAKPIDLGPEGEHVFLEIYLSGIRRAPDPNNDGNANESVRVLIGGKSIVPLYVGRHFTFVGLDQINIEIPRGLIGRGRVNLAISGAGFPTSNLGEIELAGTQSNLSPIITNFSANTVLSGQSLTISGIGFAPTPSDNIVRIGNAEATIISASPTQLVVIVPFGAESGAVKVNTPQGEGMSITSINVRTSLSGIVQDNKRQPLSGVTVKIVGTNVSATTNAEGGFLLPDVPAGTAQIEIDSSKTSNLYEKLKLRTTVIAGRDNPLGQPISAQAIAGPIVIFGANNNDGSGTNPQIVTLESAVGKAILEVQPSTFATFPDGTARGNLTLTAIENSRAPVALPTGIFSKAMVQVSPFGTTLSVGAKITFPNADGYGAGGNVKLFRWEQKDTSDKLGRFIEAGTATVSGDGQRIETAANAITEAGIYFAAQPQTTTTVIGRVIESDGTAPVRRVLVQARGQSAVTDGNGGFILRNISAKSGEAITLDVTYLRPNNRIEKVQRANVTVNINALTTIAPDIVLSANNTNRPPAIYAPSVLTVAAGGSIDTNLSVIDPDSNQTVQVNLSGVPFATLINNGNGAYTLKLAPAADAVGNYSLTITATDNQNVTTTQTIAITVLPSGPTIADFNPKSGAVGITVILTGSTLKAGTSDPVVTFTGNGNTRIPAQVTFSSSTEVRAVVPNGAISGAIELTTAAGRARTSSIFTVSNTQDFALALAPANVTTPQGSSATYIVQITSAQANFTQLVKLSLTGLPANVTASFNPEQITAGATSTLTITVGGTVSIGSYTPIIRGNTIIDGADTVRTTQASLNVQAGTQTALAGRVLSTLNEPITGATISLDGKSTQSDAAGSFLLSGVTAGQNRSLMVDGRTASAPNRTYPVITEAANVIAGKVNVIPDTYYLPPIDVAHDVEINPTQDTIATTPMLTGYKLMVPTGAKIRNLDGSPVTRMSITVLPIDRIPAPLPATATTAMVLTAQPGGAVSDVPLPVTYPNMMHSDPGTRVELYSFEHKSVQWVRYGFGRVSADGRIVEPEIDPATGKPYGLRDFAWHFFTPPPKPPKPKKCMSCPCPITHGPVDLATGNKIEAMTDISFGGARGGLDLTRMHTTNLTLGGEVGRFGRGMKDNYSIKLTGLFQEGGAGRLVPSEDSEGQLFSFTSGATTGGERGFTTNETTGQIGDVLTRKSGGTFEYRTRNSEVTRFDSTGKMIAMVDRNGNTTTLTYTGANLTKITDAVGRSLTFTYNGNKVSRATDPLERNWQYSYDGNDRLISVTDPLGSITKYEYDNFGRLLSVTDKNIVTIKRITYDGNGRVSQQVFADGGIEKYNYVTSGTVITAATVTDSLGRKSSMRLNAAGYVIGQSDALGQNTEIERDMMTNLPAVTKGPCGCPEDTKSFDPERGNLLKVTDQLGKSTSYVYENNFNFITKMTDRLGHIANYLYDARGNRVSMSNALGEATNYTYDSFGQLTAMTDALGHKTMMEYDTNGNLVARVDALGNRSTMGYDIVGRLKSITDPLGRKTLMEYDALDRVIASTDASGAVTKYGYDANGNQLTMTDALGRTWTSVYDPKNHLIAGIDSLGRVTRMEHDSEDQMTTMMSPSGRTVKYGYDARGQRTTMTDGEGGIVKFTYDNRRNLKTLSDQRGNTTTFSYDELFRPVGRTDPLGRSTFIEYDAEGNVVRTTDRLGRAVNINYDALNRRKQVGYIDATVNYSYDAAGRMTHLDDTQSGAIDWTYDDANRRLSEKMPQGLISYTYNPASQRAAMTAADRAAVNYGYDAAGRLSTIKQGAETFTYAYDTLSRMQSLARPNGVKTSYSYDEVNRLAQLTHTNASGVALEDFRYSYNADDEIAAINSLASGTLLTTAKTANAADAANRLTQFGTANFSFDSEGQTTAKTDAQGTNSYTWDARGRLTQVALPNGQTVSYGYDAMGRRASRTASGVTTSFLYDGEDVVLDKAGNGATVDYLNGLGIDQKLRLTSAGSAQYFLPDHLGSTAALTDALGTVSERAQYEAFGESAGSALTSYGFTGRELDSITRQTFYRARWYDSQQGRFIGEDPIEDEDSLNLYAYVDNSPTTLVDPLGLYFEGTHCGRGNEFCFNTDWRERRTHGCLDEACKTCAEAPKHIIRLIESISTRYITNFLYRLMGNSNSGHDKRLNEEKKTLKRCFKKLSECQSSPDCETEKVKNPLSQTNNLKLYGILGGSPLGGLGSQSGARGAGGVFGF